MKKTLALITTLLVLSMTLSGCDTTQINIPKGDFEDKISIQLSAEETATTQQMKKFKDIDELKAFLRLQSTASTPSYDMGFGSARGMIMETADMVMAEETVSVGSISPTAKESADDYSETNTQVKGVDEADYVKNDGRYIYIIADNKLVIVDAYYAENAEIISTTEIENEYSDYYSRKTAKQIFIKDDKLALFVEANEKAYFFQKYDIVPRDSYRQKTKIYIFDISDREDPKVEDTFSITGRYFQSRMIGDIIYAVSQENTMYGTYINEPLIRADTTIKPEIYYFDNPEQNYQFNTIASIDLSNNKVIDSKTLMMGYSNTLMVSENNIYIAYQKQNYWRWGWYDRSGYEKERFYEIIVPLLEGDLKSDIDKIISKNTNEDEKWRDISKTLSDFYEVLEDDEQLQDQYEDMFVEISDALEEYDMKKALEGKKTIIHKLSIDEGKIEHQAQGEVHGSLLNQFSLDEHEGNLRLATTVNIWNQKRIQYNNVYILDKDMKEIGEITDIAEDEQIYSTRFIGDRLYMVTFRQIDPFFVIDLSDPTNPEILGELKIPGYSSYLHPYDDNHIIGIGKEGDEDGRIGGVKIAMFDVTDVSKPKEIDSIEIGERGSDSAVLHDHKAFLFSKEKGVLVLPVTEIKEREKLTAYRYSNTVWNGAYVFNVDDTGFDELGKVKHSSSKSDYFYWVREASVLRSLYMDNNLYTVSNKYIKINDLKNDLEELNTVKLPYQGYDYGPKPVPMIEEAVAVDAEMIG